MGLAYILQLPSSVLFGVLLKKLSGLERIHYISIDQCHGFQRLHLGMFLFFSCETDLGFTVRQKAILIAYYFLTWTVIGGIFYLRLTLSVRRDDTN